MRERDDETKRPEKRETKLQGIFDNPSLDTPSHLSSVTDFRERDTLEYFYMYFTLDFRQFDIRHPSLFLRNRYNTLHVFFV